jgi:hypothetical protein
MKRIITVFILSLILLSACAEVIQTPPVDRKTPLYETAQDYKNRTNAESEAQNLVANQFGFEPSKVILLKTSEKTWINNCLELPNINEDCNPTEVPGFLILLYVDNHVFEVHSDIQSQNIRAINYLSQYLSPLEVAIRYLSVLENLPTEEINVVTFEPVEWPDSCLGVVEDGIVCAPVVTPGYKILLDANGSSFEFHTDFYGSRLIPIK